MSFRQLIEGSADASDLGAGDALGRRAPLMSPRSISPMAAIMWNSRRPSRAAGVDGLVENDKDHLLGGDLGRKEGFSIISCDLP